MRRHSILAGSLLRAASAARGDAPPRPRTVGIAQVERPVSSIGFAGPLSPKGLRSYDICDGHGSRIELLDSPLRNDLSSREPYQLQAKP